MADKTAIASQSGLSDQWGSWVPIIALIPPNMGIERIGGIENALNLRPVLRHDPPILSDDFQKRVEALLKRTNKRCGHVHRHPLG